MTLLGLVVPWWVRIAAIAAIVAAAAAWGYLSGRSAELDRVMAEQLQASRAREQALHEAIAKGRAAAREYATFRARAQAAQAALAEEIRRAPAPTLYQVECPEPEPAEAQPATAGDVRLTGRFVRLWDGLAESGDGVPADPGGAARAPGELSPAGIRDLLANHRDNAASCEIDRERYRRLIEFIRAHHQETRP